MKLTGLRLLSCVTIILFVTMISCRPHFSRDKENPISSLNMDSLLEVHIDTLNAYLPFELSKGLIFHDILLLDDCIIFNYWCNWKDLRSDEFMATNRDTITGMFRNVFKNMASDPKQYNLITTVLTFAGRSDKALKAGLRTKKESFTRTYNVFTAEELRDLTSDYILIKNE